MLTADQIDALGDKAQQIISNVTDFLIEDIARRISEAGQLTSTAAYQTWRLQQLGVSQRQLKKELRKRLQVSHRELRRLLEQSAEVGYNFDIRNLPYVQSVPFEKNTSIQQIVSSAVKLAQEDLSNITQTIGFVTPNGKSVGLTDAYQQACDFAFMKVSTGAQDYNSAIREATKALADKGIVTIDYDSGVHTSLEAAVRRNIMGGLGLMQEQISQQNHDDLGCDGWEISAHSASAPDHEPIQGKQYSDAEFEKLNNSLVRRIGTLNCGHAASPIILGVNSPQYTKEELEEMRQDNEKGVDYEGRHYTKYKATKRQRQLERSIRKQKRRILVDESAGDKEKLQQDQIKYQILDQEYKRFSKAAGLRLQHERMEMAGFGPKQARAAEKSYLQSQQVQKPEKIAKPEQSDRIQEMFSDVTEKWKETATPNSHTVEDLQEITIDGQTYKVDGHNAVLDYSPHEKEIAELLEKEFGGELKMVPRVNNPQGVSTPDYLFRGDGYDLKTVSGSGKKCLYDRISRKKKQAQNFIFDLSESPLTDEVIKDQLKYIYRSDHTRFVNTIIVIKNGKVTIVTSKAKK